MDVRRQEAPSLANGIALLVFDGRTSHALLTQMGIIDDLLFECKGGPWEPRNILSYHQLVSLGLDGQYYAMSVTGPLPKSPTRRLTFKRWWTESVIVTTHHIYNARQSFSRRKLVLDVRNTDGGAHWDPTLKVEYAKLSRGNAMGWQMIDSDPPKLPPVDAGDPVPSSIRQIWFELEDALVRMADRQRARAEQPPS